MHERLARLTNPRVIVPMGNYALAAMVNKNGITKHRGSIYETTLRSGRTVKVIPTIHPAAIFRKPTWEKRCVYDWKRIASDMTFPELRLPQREHFIMPTVKDVYDYLEELRCPRREPIADLISIDIETPISYSWVVTGHTKAGTPKRKKVKGQRFIACIAFSYRPDFSITIPLTKSYWQTDKKLEQAWEAVRQLCDLPIDKVFQNGWFDTFHLLRRGIRVRSWLWDTKPLHHALDPNDDHDLAYMASVDTREPYWKDEGKSDDKGLPTDLQTYWRYNGKDAAVTHELGTCYRDRLSAAGRLAFYRRHYQALLRPVLRVSYDGIRTDEARRALRQLRLSARCISLRTRLTAIAGEELYGAKGALSPKKLQKFMYETLKLPVVTKRNSKGERAATTNEVAVRKLQNRFPEKFVGADLILEHRRAAKLMSFYSETTTDADSRVRASYSITPVTGRLSSSKNPMGSGMNLQNVDREARDHFVPDEGHVFLEADLSQAESRVVYMLTGDKELVRLARTPPWEFDVHTLNASRIFHVDEAKIDKKQRYLGKRAVHAGHYGMQGDKLSEVLLLDGYVIPTDEAQDMIDAYMDWRSPIPDVFQRNTRRQVLEYRQLENSWGRQIRWTYERMGSDLFREAYAFIPQSEVADLLNQWGFIPLWRWLRKHKMQSRIRNQVHDSVLISTHPDEAWAIVEFLRASLERPRAYNGRELMIPVEFKTGMCWGKGTEFKKPPTKREFTDAVQALIASPLKAVV